MLGWVGGCGTPAVHGEPVEGTAQRAVPELGLAAAGLLDWQPVAMVQVA